MFSVIIPLYNKAVYIEKCLQSIICQTYSDFELIIVNDGSTDDSLEKVLHFRDSKFQGLQVINQSNMGVSLARNIGVKAAKYDHIAFIDADDWWEPTYLEEMKSLVKDFPEASIFGSNYYYVKYGIKKQANIAVEDSFIMGLINYCKVYASTLNMPLWTGATIIRRSVFEIEKGFKLNLELGEDFDLWIRIALKFPVAFLNKPLANYNQDVVLSGRAVGNLQKPENHMLWNLSYLANEENTNPDLKQLLDNLRAYMLFPYYLVTQYRGQARAELCKINWKNQPFGTRLKYNLPVFIVSIFWLLQKLGSRIKQFLVRSLIMH